MAIVLTRAAGRRNNESAPGVKREAGLSLRTGDWKQGSPRDSWHVVGDVPVEIWKDEACQSECLFFSFPFFHAQYSPDLPWAATK